jgi:hypothetical protein
VTRYDQRRRISLHGAHRQGTNISLDGLAAIVSVVAGLRLAFLPWVYVPGLPGGPGLMMVVVPLGMVLATTTQATVSLLVKPLGAYRSRSEAGIEYAHTAGGIE